MNSLYHTSPKPIKTINGNGLYGSFLCFAADPYLMTASADPVTYRVEIDEDVLIDASSLFYHERAAELAPLVARVARAAGVDEDTAEDLISGVSSVFDIVTDVDPEDLAELDWTIQRAAAECAKRLGFRGVIGDDEQGRVYLIDMAGREPELVQS